LSEQLLPFALDEALIAVESYIRGFYDFLFRCMLLIFYARVVRLQFSKIFATIQDYYLFGDLQVHLILVNRY